MKAGALLGYFSSKISIKLLCKLSEKLVCMPLVPFLVICKHHSNYLPRKSAMNEEQQFTGQKILY
jgi:hypothetical protein